MTGNKQTAITIDYYTDILCVWAWIAQPRLQELQLQWGKAVSVQHRYIDIFGDSHRKISTRWGETNGFENFSAHVAASAASYEEVGTHPGLWLNVQPRSSMQSYLVLKAIELQASKDMAQAAALRDGSAMAALSSDQRSATELGVKGSPTWVLNQGRQVLYGNVGYRILSANIEELLKHPGSEASWC